MSKHNDSLTRRGFLRRTLIAGGIAVALGTGMMSAQRAPPSAKPEKEEPKLASSS